MAKIIKSNKKRRFCRVHNCKQQLSMYNFSTYCHVHQHLALEKQTAVLSSASV
ncbi:MAG: hypothetical protein PHX20_06820 [Candidatus Omnitrophica bacterium]|nr:hypothetical protein [Candidatus Omnitrophota bacterium]